MKQKTFSETMLPLESEAHPPIGRIHRLPWPARGRHDGRTRHHRQLSSHTWKVFGKRSMTFRAAIRFFFWELATASHAAVI